MNEILFDKNIKTQIRFPKLKILILSDQFVKNGLPFYQLFLIYFI